MTVGRFFRNTTIALALLAPTGLLAEDSTFLIEDPNPAAIERPNIVLVLADDLGFTDLASYGSEISTPNIDALAQQGVSFTNYHTAANCAPARAMLLTGVDAHLAGVPNIPEMLAPQQQRHAHYQGVLGSNVVTVGTLLEGAGYHTYMAGKWHLGAGPGKLPSQRGFERTVALADSGADNWEQRPYIPLYDKANWYADGEEYQLPEDFYSSRFLVDKTIEFIDSNIEDGQPFFAYLPFQAVHIPVQAPQEFIDRYMGVYDGGWNELREQRRARAMELGIIPADHVYREFEAYLKCGRLEHGFLRVRCDTCHFERLVAFSCKKRGFCPSCGARRMAETAALLADDVFPDVPLRQWVISFPFPLRYLFAAHPQAMGKVLGIVYRAISTHLIHKAGLQLKDGATGAVTLIQRFGSALNLNIHFHILFLDGAYVYRDNRPLGFSASGRLIKANWRTWFSRLVSE